MEVRNTLRPGAPGTKKLAARYGERLLFVRYRYDRVRGVRVTTVELVVEETVAAPRASRVRRRAPLDPNPMVGVRIFFREGALRERAKAAGAIWRRRHKLWEMPWETACALGLESRVVCGRPGSASRNATATATDPLLPPPTSS